MYDKTLTGQTWSWITRVLASNTHVSACYSRSNVDHLELEVIEVTMTWVWGAFTKTVLNVTTWYLILITALTVLDRSRGHTPSVLLSLLTERMSSQCKVTGIEFDVIIIVIKHFILAIGVHPPFQITESDFQFTGITFNLVYHRGGRTWVGFITSSFIEGLPKYGLLRRTQVFVILII